MEVRLLRCRRCKERKPTTEFHRRGTSEWQGTCKPCDNIARVERDRKNRPAARKRYADWLARPGNKEKIKEYYKRHYAKNKDPLSPQHP